MEGFAIGLVFIVGVLTILAALGLLLVKVSGWLIDAFYTEYHRLRGSVGREEAEYVRALR